MTQPKLLLLDEPSSGLDVKETAALAERLATVQEQHEFAVLLVEHDVEMVQSLVTRLYVLDFGTTHRGRTDRRRAERRGRPQGLPRGHRVSTTNASASTPASQRPSNGGGPLLEMRDVEASYGPFRSLFGVSLAVRERSVTALLGSNGSGKTTVVRVCCGLLKPTSGHLIYQGRDITGMRAYKMARIGIVHAPEGRSVFSSLTVEENLSLTFRQVFGRTGWRRAIEGRVRALPAAG